VAGVGEFENVWSNELDGGLAVCTGRQEWKPLEIKVIQMSITDLVPGTEVKNKTLSIAKQTAQQVQVFL